MVRTFVVKDNTDLQGISGQLLDGRFSGSQADVALETLRRFNPHVDLARVAAGTVLLVPDSPGFKAAASSSLNGPVLEDFSLRIASGLDRATENLKAGLEARAAERDGVTAVIKSAIFRRLIAGDEELKQQADAAGGTLAREEEQDKQAAEDLDATARAAMAALAQLGKLFG